MSSVRLSQSAYGLSQFHDARAYEYWRRKKPGDRALWIRNNLSALVFTFIVLPTLDLSALFN